MESTGLWNVVTGIFSRADNEGSILVKIKDVKDAYQQQQQLNSELMQLKSTISERNNLLAEKEQAIVHLKGYATSYVILCTKSLLLCSVDSYIVNDVFL